MIKINILSSQLTVVCSFSALLTLKLFVADQFYIKYLFHNKEAFRGGLARVAKWRSPPGPCIKHIHGPFPRCENLFNALD